MHITSFILISLYSFAPKYTKFIIPVILIILNIINLTQLYYYFRIYKNTIENKEKLSKYAIWFSLYKYSVLTIWTLFLTYKAIHDGYNNNIFNSNVIMLLTSYIILKLVNSINKFRKISL